MEYKRFTHNPDNIEFCSPCYLCKHKDEMPKRNKHKCSMAECDYLKCYEKLSEIEDKIKQGTLIELPCKVGSNVFYVVKSFKRNGQPSSAYYYTMLGRAVWANIPTIIRTWGDTTFATREEAKKRIEELQNG